MASNIVHRRAAKALRRKALVAAKRRAENGGTSLPLPQRVRDVAARPIHSCLMHEGLLERGSGVVILTRAVGTDELAMASFLVDTFCLGVKDAFFRTIAPWDLEACLDDAAAVATPFVAVEPSFARKLVGDATRYAAGLGLTPHPDFAAIEALFGDVRADDCDVTFPFGRDGRPLYMVGPTESPMQIRARLAQLRRQLGDDGFAFVGPDMIHRGAAVVEGVSG
ncbi:MAG: hypothetical protein HY060_05160 [Proteobacteria bacterium]|nr:hypothetical protein [Pseudomonadota bacterium]